MYRRTYSTWENPIEKCTVATLPGKRLKGEIPLLNPQRRAALHFLDYLRNGRSARQCAQNMHVIFDSSDLNRLTLQLFEDSAEVTVDLGSERHLLQEWFYVPLSRRPREPEFWPTTAACRQ